MIIIISFQSTVSDNALKVSVKEKKTLNVNALPSLAP